jgi:hypothetical protein
VPLRFPAVMVWQPSYLSISADEFLRIEVIFRGRLSPFPAQFPARFDANQNGLLASYDETREEVKSLC